jgi:hypothetical protein
VTCDRCPISLLCFGGRLHDGMDVTAIHDAVTYTVHAWMCPWCRRFVVTVQGELYRLHCPARPYTVALELSWRNAQRGNHKVRVPVLPPGISTNWINQAETRCVDNYSIIPLIMDEFERGLLLTLAPCPRCHARRLKIPLAFPIVFDE